MNPAELKLHLLLEGLRIDYPSLEGSSFKSDKYLHNDRHFTPAEYKHAVPQELLLGDQDPLCVGVLVRPQSPFCLHCNGEGPFITFGGKAINIKVRFIPEPEFWKKKTTDGIPMYLLLSVPGLNELNLWPWHDCALHYEQQGCFFCTTTSTAVSAGTGPKSNLLSVHKINRVLMFDDVFKSLYPVLLMRAMECLKAALQCDFQNSFYWFTVISGNLTTTQLSNQNELVQRLVKDIVRDVPSLRGRIVSNVMPPNDTDKLFALREAGVNFYMANLELWEPSYFRRICPGKALYGRTRFIQMLQAASDIFGKGNVWCNFVCGLEPLDSQLTGYEFLASYGIVSGANVFHKDPKIKVNAVEGFGFESARRYYLQAAEILHKWGLKPFYSLGSRRSSLLWEAYLDLL